MLQHCFKCRAKILLKPYAEYSQWCYHCGLCMIFISLILFLVFKQYAISCFFTIIKKKKIKEEKHPKNLAFVLRKTVSLQFPESQARLCYSWLARIVYANEVTHCGSPDNFRMVRLERPCDDRVGAVSHLISP